MNNVRVYGEPPYKAILIHGGPGARGEMKPLARDLSRSMGIIEPLQTKTTITELVSELNEIIELYNNDDSVNLIGFSWGAWLSTIFTSIHPNKVRKLIIVGSGPFEESYAQGIMKARFNRMNEADIEVFQGLQQKLLEQDIQKDEIFKQMAQLISKVDSYDPFYMDQDDPIEVNFDAYNQIWKEASSLRKSGELIKLTYNISCPVVAIHGEFDPHPYVGVIEPLSRTIKSFKYTILEKCGHKPWVERYAREKFIRLLMEELL
jgi:pimeloyl-ACP methyl ester carboxylesterase